MTIVLGRIDSPYNTNVAKKMVLDDTAYRKFCYFYALKIEI